MRSAIRRTLATARTGNWWSSKLPPLFVIAYAEILRRDLPALASLAALGEAIVALSIVAWHAHVVNDLCDIEEDRLSGKSNRMEALTYGRRALLALGLPVLALATGWIAGGRPSLILLAVNIGIFLLYSVRPVRLKARRWWGVAADATGAHALPMLVVLSVLPGGVSGNALDIAFAASAVTWSLAAGVRGIIVHQFLDRAADGAAGLSTLGTTMSVVRARALVLHRLWPVESMALVLFVGMLMPSAPLLLVATVLFWLVERGRIRRSWHLPLFEPAETSIEPYLPLLNNDAYELWLPIVLALQLGARGGALVALPLLQIGLFLRSTLRRVHAVAALAPAGSVGFKTGVTPLHPRIARPARVLSVAHEPPSATLPVADGKPPVVIGATYWVVNGVNVFSANLARGLGAAGEPAQVLLTESSTKLITFRETLMPRSPDVAFAELPVKAWEPWGAHWGEMIRYLESQAPCVYIPNSDWRHSAVVPLLSKRVAVVGVVHSDDPLHYDHVTRLGRYWNAIVTVSHTIAERTAKLLPELADRIVTIPIGVSIPSEMPVRESIEGAPLRLIYHGALKRHQKRILDLPRIMQALTERGVAAKLTVAGSGPDEQQLRDASEDLVERGVIDFVGVVPHHDIEALLAQHDVYLLTSEFEGMPNALIEAMGSGLVPVVTRTASGSSELVRDGENGYLIPVGDIAAFAERLVALHADRGRLRELGKAAFEAVRGSYRVKEMVDDYRGVFERVLREAANGDFIRPRGELSHPPASVAGVSLFPVALNFAVPGIGRFPGEDDYNAFRYRVRRVARMASIDWLPRVVPGKPTERLNATMPKDVGVVVASPIWGRNGVNVHSQKLVRGLVQRGIDARLLLTEEHTDLVTVPDPRLTIPIDVPVDVLPVGRSDGWGAHWGAMIRYLEQHAPCVYLPTYDWRHACVAPLLSRRVYVIGSAFKDDPCTLEQVRRLARHLSAVVVRDAEAAGIVRATAPSLAHRVTVIPEGYHIPERMRRAPPAADGSIEVLACGGDAGLYRSELPALLSAVRDRGVDARIAIMGNADNPEVPVPELDDTWQRPITSIPWPVPDEHFERATVVIAWLHGGEMPAELLKAMGWGAVPIVIDCGVGVPHTFRFGENCLIAAMGDTEAIADHITELVREHDFREMLSLQAHGEALRAAPTLDDILDRYVDLFAGAVQAATMKEFVRPTGPMLPPPPQVGDISIFPVTLAHDEPGLGRFPGRADVEAFLKSRG